MSELVKSGVLGIIAVMMLVIGAHFTNEVGETEIERRLNIKKKVVKVEVVAEKKALDKKDLNTLR